MKLVYTIGLSLFGLAALAQNKSDGIGWRPCAPAQRPAPDAARAVLDTLLTPHIYGLSWGTPLPGCEEIGIYTDGSGGYVGGNNVHGDREKMQKFHIPGMLGVFETLVLFAHKTVAHPDSAIYSNIYTVDPVTHGPGELVFTSDPRLLSEVYVSSTSLNYTSFPFPLTIPIADSFFVSFTLPRGVGDTVVAAMSTHGCYPGHQVAWEMESDSSFQPFNNGTPSSWELNVEIFMAAVIEMQTAGGEVLPAVYKGLTLHPAFPVPAGNALTVKFDLAKAHDVELQITDLTGRVLSRTPLGVQTQGAHQAVLDVTSLPAGVYNYGIRFGSDALFSRFVKNAP
ncbi:MAG TPA: T9SS type A sorting domain-containing protein [Chitinophagales bacterium]|nr:T9SS type A sorting domain-containing protein [Chitinophagales bacterium]